MILYKCLFRTQWEAKDLGWIIQPQSEYFLGKRFAHQDDDSLMLIFDDAGYIAGTQSVIRTHNTDTDCHGGQPCLPGEEYTLDIH